MKTTHFTRNGGFSLVEAIATLCVLAILAGLAIYAPSRLNRTVESNKLTSDVATLNSAVASYIAFNGKLSDAKTPEQVLKSLKSVANAESKASNLGLNGSFIDPRTDIIMQDENDVKAGEPAAFWDPTINKFVVRPGKVPGIKKFVLNESAVPSEPLEEKRGDPSMKLAKEDTWIWDYEEKAITHNSPTNLTPSKVSPTDSEAETPTPPGTPVDHAKENLLPPAFSIPGGDYPIADYSLQVALIDSNASGLAQIAYSIDYGNWMTYLGGTITVPPGANLRAQAVPYDSSKYHSSGQAQANYDALPEALQPPTIQTSAKNFDKDETPSILVTLNNPNDSAISKLMYKVTGGGWLDYAAPFTLLEKDYPEGTVIETRAVSTNQYYTDSETVSESLGNTNPTPPFSISGNADGKFSKVQGQGNLISNLIGNSTSNFLEWGKAIVSKGQNSNNSIPGTNGSWASSMMFTGKSFEDITTGERFQLGTISYYNGTIEGGTGATSTNLTIEIVVKDHGTVTFEHTIEMINSPNVDGDPKASADSVKFTNLKGEQPATIGDKKYNLYVEFGQTSDKGFATIDEFSVYENETAQGTVFGRLEEAK